MAERIECNRAGNTLAETLLEAWRRASPAEDLSETSAAVVRALLDFGSETDDNRRCLERISYGLVSERSDGPPLQIGLKLSGCDVLLSDVAYAIESAPMPDSVRADCPAMSADDWQAATRALTLLALGFDKTFRRVEE